MFVKSGASSHKGRKFLQTAKESSLSAWKRLQCHFYGSRDQKVHYQSHNIQIEILEIDVNLMISINLRQINKIVSEICCCSFAVWLLLMLYSAFSLHFKFYVYTSLLFIHKDFLFNVTHWKLVFMYDGGIIGVPNFQVVKLTTNPLLQPSPVTSLNLTFIHSWVWRSDDI